MHLKKILGLDIGTASVGWAVSKEIEKDKWTIDDFGVRIFDEPFEENKTISSAAERRAFRSKRRLIRRKIRRIRDLKDCLEKYSNGSITKQEIKDHFDKLNDKNTDYKYSDEVNPYFIRKKAIDGEKINWLQFAIALINIAKRRGYDESFILKFNDSDKTNSEKSKNDDGYFEKINQSKKLIGEHQFPINALEHLNDKFKYVKNTIPRKNSNKSKAKINKKSHDFFYFSRNDYINEVKEIIKKQQKNLNLSQELIKKLIGANEVEEKETSVIFRQRPFEVGPGKEDDKKRKYKGFSQDNVGNDIFLNEKRMWSSLIINDLFVLLNEISKIRIDQEIKNEDLINLNQSIILKYFDCILNDNKTFEKEFLLCALKFNIQKENIHFQISENFKISNLFLNNICQIISDDFLKKGIKEIKEFVFTKNKNFDAIEANKFVLDKFGKLIAENITPWYLLKKLKEEKEKFYYQFDEKKIDNKINKESSKNKKEFKNLDEKIKYVLSQISTSPSKVSYKYACMALNGFLFEGKKYADFQKDFDEDISRNYKVILKEPFGQIRDPDIANNPVVMRALSQARKIVKKLYEKYKWFDSIVIESARELTSSLKDKAKIKNKQKKNYDENQDVSDILKNHKILDSEINRRKVKLFNRQNGLSVYSGKPIDLSRLDDYEIDHIIPKTKIKDDSFDNTVLALKEENQIKKNRMPLEAGNDLIKDIKAYKLRCLLLKKNKLITKRKYILLLAESSNDENVKDIINYFASRQINDTRYISKYFTSYLKKSIEIYRDNNIQYKKYNFNIFNPAGPLTSGYRKEWLKGSGWGTEIKNRNISHFHHAVDAIILCNMASQLRIRFYTDCLRILKLVKAKNEKNLSEKERQEKINELDETYNEIVDSWKKEKNFYYFLSPKYIENIEKIKNMEFKSFSDIAKPIVDLKEMQNHIDKRIPIKLTIEEKNDKNKKSRIYKVAKIERIIWEEEYNEKIDCLKKLFPESNIRYPFISYKQNNKIRGNFAYRENYVGRNSKELKNKNEEKISENGYKIIKDKEKKLKGILDIRKYYGVLVFKYSKQKCDIVKIKRFDIMNKFSSQLNILNKNKTNDSEININDIHNEFFKEYISNKSKQSDSKILAVLRPGTIFSIVNKKKEREICVYTGLSGTQIRAPYIFVPMVNYKEVTGKDLRCSKSSLSGIKVLKIDILGRKIN